MGRCAANHRQRPQGGGSEETFPRQRRSFLSTELTSTGTNEAGPIDYFLALFGACHGGPDRKYVVIEAETKIADKEHPIARGIAEKFKVKDEFYYRLKVVKQDEGLKPILRVPIEGKDEMV